MTCHVELSARQWQTETSQCSATDRASSQTRTDTQYSAFSMPGQTLTRQHILLPTFTQTARRKDALDCRCAPKATTKAKKQSAQTTWRSQPPTPSPVTDKTTQASLHQTACCMTRRGVTCMVEYAFVDGLPATVIQTSKVHETFTRESTRTSFTVCWSVPSSLTCCVSALRWVDWGRCARHCRVDAIVCRFSSPTAKEHEHKHFFFNC